MRRQVSALAGVAPYNHDSGRLKGKRCISGGRASLRTALYIATLAATRFNPVIRAFYSSVSWQQEKQRRSPWSRACASC